MRIIFFTSRRGAKPVKQGLEDLERERPDEYKATVGKQRVVRELSFAECLEAEHIKSVRGKIWSLKVQGHQPRILGFRWKDAFVLARMTIKKQDKLDERDIRIAENRREDWFERYGS